MRFKVPQDVQRADQILWFITLPQLIILIAGGGISYLLYSSLSKSYQLGEIEIILICIPALIGAAFAFLKIKGIALFKFILLLIEQLFFRAPRRRWISGAGAPFVSMTNPFSMQKKVVEEEKEKNPLSAKNVKNLAQILDGKTPAPN